MIIEYKNTFSDEKYRYLLEHMEEFPFCFKYGDKIYKGFGELEFLGKVTKTDGSIETNILTYRLDVVKVEVKYTHYYSHGFSEWTVWFENNTDKNIYIISAKPTFDKNLTTQPIIKTNTVSFLEVQ